MELIIGLTIFVLFAMVMSILMYLHNPDVSKYAREKQGGTWYLVQFINPQGDFGYEAFWITKDEYNENFYKIIKKEVHEK